MHGMHALDFTPSWCSGYFACPFFGLDIEAVSTYLAPHLRGSTLDGLDGTPGGTNFHAAAVVLNGKERISEAAPCLAAEVSWLTARQQSHRRFAMTAIFLA